MLAVAAGLAVGVVFVRRQLTLQHPMLDLRLFKRPAFSVSLGAQSMALFIMTGIQFLILQYFQLVLGLSPLQAGLWALPAMAAGVVGSLLAPALTRWMRPAWVMSSGFATAIAGLGLLAGIDEEHGLILGAIGFAIPSFSLNAALALTNDLIISSAPPERAGNASGIGETGAELGNALGVAVGGSIATAVYRGQVTQAALPDGLRPGIVDTARDTLGSATAAAAELPGRIGPALLDVARAALAALIDIGLAAALALVIALLLGRVPAGPGSETDLTAAPSAEPVGDGRR